MRVAISNQSRFGAGSGSFSGVLNSEVLARPIGRRQFRGLLKPLLPCKAITRSFRATLDVLVANAGVGHFAAVTDHGRTMETDHWYNLTGVFHGIKIVSNPWKNAGIYYQHRQPGRNQFFERPQRIIPVNSDWWVLRKLSCSIWKYGIKWYHHAGIVASYFNNHTPNEADAWKIQPEDIGELVYRYPPDEPAHLTQQDRGQAFHARGSNRLHGSFISSPFCPWWG